MKSYVSGILLSLVLLTTCGEDSPIRSMPQSPPATVQSRQSTARDADANPPFLPFIKRFAQGPLGQSEEKLSQFVYVRTRCNIRSGPGIKYSVIRKANKGDKLEYVFLGGDWYKLRVSTSKAPEWVHRSVVKWQIRPGEKRPFVDLNQIVNKTPMQVERYLGRPLELKADSYRSLGGKAFRVEIGKYRKGLFHITFIENGARYIDIFLQGIDPNYHRHSYPSETRTLLGDLGLDGNASAFFSNQFVTIWKGLSGIYEISMFPGPKNRISYVQVLTESKYE